VVSPFLGPESMASQQFDPKTGKTRVFFRYDGRQYNRTVKTESARTADALCEGTDLLRIVYQR
jgi:hypothetical protein